jgi:hypothetical protein
VCYICCATSVWPLTLFGNLWLYAHLHKGNDSLQAAKFASLRTTVAGARASVMLMLTMLYATCCYDHTDAPPAPNTSSQRNTTCTPPPIPDTTETTSSTANSNSNNNNSNTTANDGSYSPETPGNQSGNKGRQSSGRKVVNAGEWLKDGKV